MTTDETQIENQVSDPFSFLYKCQFALLKTFRKNGDAVPTPIWFAPENGKLYITTASNTGKIKRIRNNGHVTLTPCDRTGKIIGDGREVIGIARELPVTEYQHAHSILAHKYGFMFRVIRLIGTIRKAKRVYIEVTPA